jgi:O-antigen ligase
LDKLEYRKKASKSFLILLVLPILFLGVGFFNLMILSKSLISFFILIVTLYFFSQFKYLKLYKLNSAIFGLLFLFFIFGSYSSFISPTFSINTFLISIQFILYFLFFLLLLNNCNVSENTSIRYFQLSIYSSFIFFCCDSFLFYLSGNLITSDLGQTRLAFSLGPSAGAIYLLAIHIAHLGLPRILPVFMHNFLMILIPVFIILTGTRIAFLALLVTSFYLHRSEMFKSNKNNFNNFVKICFVIFIIFYGSFIFYNRLFFADGTFNINTNGRLQIWLQMLNHAYEKIYFGHGWGASSIYLTSSGLGDGFGIQPHNDYLRILFDTGIIGLLFFSLLIIKVWLAIGRTKSIRSKVAKAYLICFLILMVTDNVFIYHFYIYPALFFIALIITHNLRTKQQNESCNYN